MTRPAPRLVYDRDAASDADRPPVACRCEKCREREQQIAPKAIAAAAIVGTLIGFVVDPHGMMDLLAAMIGLR